MFKKIFKLFVHPNDKNSPPPNYFLDLPFEGLCRFPSKDGVCFVRAKTDNNKIYIFCAQLPQYTRTSITNRIEQIAQRFSHQPDKIVVIEHYAKGLGLAENGSYALVEFDENFQPDWTYYPLDTISEIYPFITTEFCQFNPNEFVNWEEKENVWK